MNISRRLSKILHTLLTFIVLLILHLKYQFNVDKFFWIELSCKHLNYTLKNDPWITNKIYLLQFKIQCHFHKRGL